MVILEGPDTSGKTTLANLIVQRFGAHFEHLGLPPVGVRHYDIVRTNLVANYMNTVYDRMMLGSYVFGKVKPDEHNRNPVVWEELENWITALSLFENTVLVLAKPSIDELKRRFKTRGDSYITEEELYTSASLYYAVYETLRDIPTITHIKILMYNSETTTAEEFVFLHTKMLYSALKDNRQPDWAQVAAIRGIMA